MGRCIADDLIQPEGTWLHPEPLRQLNILYVHCVIITDVGAGWLRCDRITVWQERL